METEMPTVEYPAVFKIKLAPYWTSVAVYSITFLLYILIRALWDATLQDGIVNVVITDPMVVVLGLFVIVSSLSLVFNAIMRRAIIVTRQSITFTSKFHLREFTHEEISKVVVGRDRRMRVRGRFSLVKIYVKGRRRALRIRPGVFENDTMLLSALRQFSGDRKQQ
ncbi:MAG: hypothetical protein HQ472_11125 [Ignavibacteria bacterium]|nr:hypothetical protein [Ignavibacteria bacterium]